MGLILHKKVGDFVRKGEPMATIFANDPEEKRSGGKKISGCLPIGAEPVKKPKLIKAVIR